MPKLGSQIRMLALWTAGLALTLLTAVSSADPATRIGNVAFGMSEVEFDHLRVTLPAPLDEPWKGPFYDSESCFKGTATAAAVEVLPIWIRTGIIAGELAQVGRYLWTYLKFIEDADPKIASKAVITLYRMGDYHDLALAKMRKWIESGFHFWYTAPIRETSDFVDIRRQILLDLDFYNDSRLDQTIYDVWSRDRGGEGKELWFVDYGYYLETHDRKLPDEYWMERLDTPHGIGKALEVLEKRKPEGLIERLESLFSKLRVKQGHRTLVTAKSAALIGSTLFRLTKNRECRDYLVDRARFQLGAAESEDDLSVVLEALARTEDAESLKVVFEAAQHKYQGIREKAVHALGCIQNSGATDFLYQRTMESAKRRTGFPSHELRALLEQHTPLSDAKYEELHQALLNGQFGWTAVSSDFKFLEFFRAHRRP